MADDELILLCVYVGDTQKRCGRERDRLSSTGKLCKAGASMRVAESAAYLLRPSSQMLFYIQKARGRA